MVIPPYGWQRRYCNMSGHLLFFLSLPETTPCRYCADNDQSWACMIPARIVARAIVIIFVVIRASSEFGKHQMPLPFTISDVNNTYLISAVTPFPVNRLTIKNAIVHPCLLLE